MTTVESIIESFPEKQAAALAAVRSQLHDLLPTAIEDLTWGMPTLRVEGIIAVSFLGFSHHNSLFPGPEVQELLGPALDGYTTTKGTIHFDQHKAPPKAFLKKLVEARITVINSSFPKKSGAFLELYKNGVVKARGSYKGEAMHGAWSFYRKDGTPMRSGSFRLGEQVGTWITYDSAGRAYKETQFAR
ncbi:MAG: DUF1801 domain-containing protein [Pontimonas sp.]|nr:DUF1801 domain-containing protein [Pontimonas sp.]